MMKNTGKQEETTSLSTVITEKFGTPPADSVAQESQKIQDPQVHKDLNAANEELKKKNEELGERIAEYSSSKENQNQDITLEDSGIRLADGTLLKLEELYRAFGEFIDYGIWVCGTDGLNLYTSQSFLNFSGLNLQQCTGFGWTEALHSEDKDNTISAWMNSIKEGKNLYIEHRFRAKDGSWHFVLTKGIPVKNEQGEIVYWLGINLDIDKQKQTEVALIESRRREEMHVQELKELNENKDKLFSIIAHDLINPFNSILGFSDLLQKNLEKYDKANIERFLNIIISTSQKAYNLLENLLNWSRSQTGNLAFNPAVYNLTDLIQANIQLAENMAWKKNIRIEFDASVSCLVVIDKNMIDTVLRNLLTNAIKFSYPGGKITILTEPDEQFCRIMVIDEGTGITEENLRNLFQPGKRILSSGTIQEKGSGLGLLLCKEFVEKNKGEIWVRSEPGKGSEFIFTLPRAHSGSTQNG